MPLPPGCPRSARLDYLTREIHSFVRSQGVATFAQIDAHIKAQPGCVKQIAGKQGRGCCRCRWEGGLCGPAVLGSLPCSAAHFHCSTFSNKMHGSTG